MVRVLLKERSASYWSALIRPVNEGPGVALETLIHRPRSANIGAEIGAAPDLVVVNNDRRDKACQKQNLRQ